MRKQRVYELAKELNMDSKGLVEKLQEFGKVHVVFEKEGVSAGNKKLGKLGEIQEAIAYLEQCPKQFPEAKYTSSVNADEIIERILEIKENRIKLNDEKLTLERKLEQLKYWGDFKSSEIEKELGLKFYFYVVPKKSGRYVEELELPHKVVNEDSINYYLVIISDKKPKFPIEPVRLPEESMGEILKRLEEIDLILDREYSERIKLTRYTQFLKDYVDFVEDSAQLLSATLSTKDMGEFFILSSFIPVEHVEELEEFAEEAKVAVAISEPEEDDLPPTLFKNSVPYDSGEDLVNVYSTPGYKEWDPSAAVYISFAIFYAMIVGDAGYGVIFLLITLFTRGKLLSSESGKKFYRLMMTLSLSTIVYGIMTGGYFGVELSDNFILKKLALVSPTDPKNLVLMMTISIFIGCIHIIVANLITAKNQFPKLTMLGSVGWVFNIIGGFMVWQFAILGKTNVIVSGLNDSTLAFLTRLSYGFIGIGVAMVFLFSSESRNLITRAVDGLLALTKISAAFGDILSYLRLFALGLSSSGCSAFRSPGCI